MTNTRIKKMVQNWKKEHRAFSSVKSDDSEFFELIKKNSFDVGITSQTGGDLLYFDTDYYDSGSDATKNRVAQRYTVAYTSVTSGQRVKMALMLTKSEAQERAKITKAIGGYTRISIVKAN